MDDTASVASKRHVWKHDALTNQRRDLFGVSMSVPTVTLFLFIMLLALKWHLLASKYFHLTCRTLQNLQIDHCIVQQPLFWHPNSWPYHPPKSFHSIRFFWSLWRDSSHPHWIFYPLAGWMADMRPWRWKKANLSQVVCMVVELVDEEDIPECPEPEAAMATLSLRS